MDEVLKLYKSNFIERDFERLDLFQLIDARFAISRVLYPGCFIHLTPSFVFSNVTYVDMDQQTRMFFDNPSLKDFVASNKLYPEEASITFYALDYRTPIAQPDQSFDLLISQYAGFVSQHCKKYLRRDGILLVNNSHGDASMAYIDSDYTLIAVILRKDGRHRLSDENLSSYFVPKKPREITRDFLAKTQKGIGYKKSAASYLFKRNN